MACLYAKNGFIAVKRFYWWGLRALGGPSLCLSFYVDGAYFVLIGVAVSAWLEFDAGFDDFAAKFDHVLDILYVRFGCYCGSAC